MIKNCPEMSRISDTPILILRDIAVRLGERILLSGTSWTVRAAESWAVIGPNGAGKSSLLRAIAGDLPVVRGTILRHDGEAGFRAMGSVSPEIQHRILARDEAGDEARWFSGNPDGAATARQTLASPGPFPKVPRPAAEGLAIEPLLDKSIRFLSTGEMRKVLIARSLVASPRLLLLDEPMEGLDAASRAAMVHLLEQLARDGVQIILATHRFDELIPSITHVLCLKAGKVVARGRREEILLPERMSEIFDGGSRALSLPGPVRAAKRQDPRVLIAMKDVEVGYGDIRLLEKITWTVRHGENWAILGPNGAGKSTLLRLIAADHPQAYANEIVLFGRRRGTGESIWEIKKRIGLVSFELQSRYRSNITVFDVVVSGFFDSVGLYRQATEAQRGTARQWLRRLGIEHLSDRPFISLSYGEGRMVLLTRALVKSPELLILDEPCQGLDPANRKMVLELIDWIGTHTDSRILHVTHHREEIPACITHVLELRKTPSGAFTAFPQETGNWKLETRNSKLVNCR